MRIDAIRVSKAALKKLAGRGIRESDPYEAHANGYVLLRNKKRRAGTHRMVGPTDAGRLLTLPVRRTEDRGVWLVVNGWDASAGERTLYEKGMR